MLFPSFHRAGSCSAALLQFLLEENNQKLLRYCDDARIERPPKISPEQLTEDQVVCFDESALHLLLLASSKYELNVGGSGETTWDLDVDGLERRVVERQGGKKSLRSQANYFITTIYAYLSMSILIWRVFIYLFIYFCQLLLRFCVYYVL